VAKQQNSTDLARYNHRAHWLPDFCTAPTLLAVIFVAQLVALIAALTGSHDHGLLLRLGPLSVFVQWVALCCAAALCLLRKKLLLLPPAVGITIAYLCVLALTACCSLVAMAMDAVNGLRLVPNNATGPGFILSNVLIAGILAAVALRYGYVHMQWRSQLEASSKAQVEALQARIRPHFLFNSMNSIASLIRSQPKIAEETVEDLAELFRAALSTADQHVLLGDEISLAQRYLQIEQRRLGDRLRFAINVSDDAREILVPPLILQPLVENAVYHGIQPMEMGGQVDINAGVERHILRISVGNPRDQHAADTSGHGIAQENIRARLRFAFGPQADMIITNSATDYQCTLLIPLPVES
jgi:two-component system, LytTR family, sensor histidine kinase AlgZ